MLAFSDTEEPRFSLEHGSWIVTCSQQRVVRLMVGARPVPSLLPYFVFSFSLIVGRVKVCAAITEALANSDFFGGSFLPQNLL